MRKKRINIILKKFNKKDFFFNTIKFIIEFIMNIFITLILKIFNLRLILTSYKTIILILKFNKSKISSR